MKIHITKNHTGKMNGMQSISTCCLCNPACMARAKDPGCVCSHCFAAALLKRYKSAIESFTENSRLLSGSVLDKKDLPRVNACVFRLEAFGDLINDTHVKNYFNICKVNPRTTFALWTKNPGYIEKAINDGYKKPRNLIIIYSSPKLNTPASQAINRFPFIDKVFTVFTPDFIKENSVDINCGARNCFECQRCYSKRTGKEINEKLK